MGIVNKVNMSTKMCKLDGLEILPRFKGIEEQIKQINKLTKNSVIAYFSIGIKDNYLNGAKILVKTVCKVLNKNVCR